MEHGAQEDWTDLGPGDRVTVVPQQGQEFPEIVHSKMPNSSVIWILPDNSDSRRAYDHREGVLLVPCRASANRSAA